MLKEVGEEGVWWGKARAVVVSLRLGVGGATGVQWAVDPLELVPLGRLNSPPLLPVTATTLAPASVTAV